MKVAISNIAWPAAEETRAAQIMQSLGVRGVELAPTKNWPDLSLAPDAEIAEYRKWWESRGIEIVAIQSLLFGRPGLTVFGPPKIRTAALHYLRHVIRVAADLGAHALVFGSPKNRRVGDLPKEEIRSISREFFTRLGDAAQESGVVIGIEANPTQYGADFLTDAGQSTAFVKDLNHPGIRLHLCTGCMALAGDDPVARVREGGSLIGHFHVSAPYLNAIDDSVDHAGIAAALHEVGYQGWASIEMKTIEPFSIRVVEEAMRKTLSHYSAK